MQKIDPSSVVIAPPFDFSSPDQSAKTRMRALRIATTYPPALADALDALLVMVLDKTHHAWMVEHDPMALAQAEKALDLATPDLPNPFAVGDPVLYHDADFPQYGVVTGIDEVHEGFVTVAFGDGTSRYIQPWNWRIAPSDKDVVTEPAEAELAGAAS